jgi:hypothetical protein
LAVTLVAATSPSRTSVASEWIERAFSGSPARTSSSRTGSRSTSSPGDELDVLAAVLGQFEDVLARLRDPVQFVGDVVVEALLHRRRPPARHLDVVAEDPVQHL